MVRYLSLSLLAINGLLVVNEAMQLTANTLKPDTVHLGEDDQSEKLSDVVARLGSNSVSDGKISSDDKAKHGKIWHERHPKGSAKDPAKDPQTHDDVSDVFDGAHSDNTSANQSDSMPANHGDNTSDDDKGPEPLLNETNDTDVIKAYLAIESNATDDEEATGDKRLMGTVADKIHDITGKVQDGLKKLTGQAEDSNDAVEADTEESLKEVSEEESGDPVELETTQMVNDVDLESQEGVAQAWQLEDHHKASDSKQHHPKHPFFKAHKKKHQDASLVDVSRHQVEYSSQEDLALLWLSGD